jgi:hypothetical protein
MRFRNPASLWELRPLKQSKALDEGDDDSCIDVFKFNLHECIHTLTYIYKRLKSFKKVMMWIW